MKTTNTNNVQALTKAQQTKADIVAAAAIVADGAENVSIMGETVKFDTVAVGNTTGIADLTQYKNLKNKELSKSFDVIEKFKKTVRLSLIGIGGELARINYTKSYKDDFPKMTFAKFCTDIIGIPKATAYRYIGVYSMCADVTGKVNPDIAALSDAQLRALYASGASYNDVLELANNINANTSTDAVKQLVADLKQSQNETVAETETETESTETETETETESTEKMVSFKGTIKGMTPLKVPEKVLESAKSLYKYLQEKAPHKLDRGVTLYDVHKGTVVDYIIVHNETMQDVLTFFYKHGDYNIKENK